MDVKTEVQSSQSKLQDFNKYKSQTNQNEKEGDGDIARIEDIITAI